MEWFQEVKEICVKDFLVPFEGYARKLPDGNCVAYPDPASPLGLRHVSPEGMTQDQLIESGRPWTIGYGSTFDEDGSPVLPGMTWTKEKAMRVKQVVLRRFFQELLSFSPGLVTEPPRRVAAILSWYYNLGKGNYRVSTFKKKIDLKEWDDAAEECMKWDKAQGRKLRGLTLRRQAEALSIRTPEM